MSRLQIPQHASTSLDGISLDKSHAFALHLHKGDKIDVYDEEMQFWEVATIQKCNPSTRSIEFSIDSDKNLDFVWEENINDVDLAPYKTYSVDSKPLSFPTKYYVNHDEITTLFDAQGEEYIIMGLQSMKDALRDTNCCTLSSSVSCTQYIAYNLTTNRYFSIPWIKDAVLFNQNIQNMFNAQHITHYIDAYGFDAAFISLYKWQLSVRETAHHQCCDMNKIYITNMNELHILTHDLCGAHSYHIRCNLDKKQFQFQRAFGENNDLLYGGKLCHVASAHKLLYFGGKHDIYGNDEDISHDIWCYDLVQSDGWKRYKLKMPQIYDNDFSVIAAGELVFVFYHNISRHIYIYNLFLDSMYQISNWFPAPYRGIFAAIKTSDDRVHFMNGCKVKQDENKDVAHHFCMDLKQLIPQNVYRALDERYHILVHAYVVTHIADKFGDSFSLYLKSIIHKYLPVFL